MEEKGSNIQSTPAKAEGSERAVLVLGLICGYSTKVDITLLRKEIKFRASRRGMKELDVLFARFMNVYFDQLTPAELMALAELVKQPDGVLWGWVETKTAPAPFHTGVFEKLINTPLC